MAKRETGDVRQLAETVFRAVTDDGMDARLEVENAHTTHPEYHVVLNVDPSDSMDVLLHEHIVQCVAIAESNGARLSLMRGELAFLWPIDHVPGPVGQDSPAQVKKALAHDGPRGRKA